MAYRYQEFDWYEVPLFYDMVFNVGTETECDFLEVMYQRYAPTKQRRILEPACGTGRLVFGLAQRGYRVLGFDISPGSLAFARKRMSEFRPSTADTTRPRIMHADMACFDFGRTFDLAHCLVSSFHYLSSERQARMHLECVARALAPATAQDALTLPGRTRPRRRAL
jgi:SAM-dependent methyltransferase